MLIPTYYLLSKIWDIFATRRRILLEINKNYFRGGKVTQTNNNNYPHNHGDYADFFVPLRQTKKMKDGTQNKILHIC